MLLAKLIRLSLNIFCCLMMSNILAKQGVLTSVNLNSGEQFGYSVAIHQNRILVGAHKTDIDGVIDAGAAYIYQRGELGWYQQARLIASSNTPGDTLGGHVALGTDTAMVGGMRRDDKGADSGAVIAFTHESKKWQQHQIITAPDGKSGDAFGQAIAIADDTVVIGAPRHDALGLDAGAVYIFQRQHERWQFHTKLFAKDGVAGDLFGISVAIDGDTILVGADLNDQQASNAGAVYAYVLTDNEWHQEAKLIASDGESTDIFGVRVALSGNTALISARRDDVDKLGVDAGSAYIFTRQHGRWFEKQKLISPDGAADDRFGRGVALNKDTALISAMNHDANGDNTGALYVYKKDKHRWYFDRKVLAENASVGDQFGWNVALSEEHAVIAAPNYDRESVESGAVFVESLSVTLE